MKIRIVTRLEVTEAQKQKLTALGCDYFADDFMHHMFDQAELSRRIGNADIAVVGSLVPITASFMEAHPALRMIQSVSKGLDFVDRAAAVRQGIEVRTAGDYATEAVAERTLALMLLAANRLAEANLHVKAGHWEMMRWQGRELRGRTLLIIGMGDIGMRVAELASAFGMKIESATSSTSSADLHAMLASADFISLHCPLTHTK